MCQAASTEIDEPVGLTPESDAAAPPPAPLGRLEILRAFRVWMWESPMSSAQGALTTGTFQTGYALFLGCNSFLLGVLAAIPPLVSLLQLVSSYLAHMVASRRRIVGIAALSGRLVWIPILAIPWILPRSAWVGAFLILSLLSSGLLSITAPLWMDWMSDIVPPGKRGRYFGQRNVYGGLTAMAFSVGGGAFLDESVKNLHWSETDAFALLFGLSCVFAVASFTCCMASPDIAERPRDSHPAVSLKHALETYLAPVRDLPYRKVILSSLAVIAVQTFAGNFFVAYQLQPLHLSYAVIQILGIASSVAALMAMPFWGYLADKFGNKPVLILSTFLVLPTSVMWCLTTPDAYPGLYAVASNGQVAISSSKLMIVAINFLSAIGWSGVGMTQFNLMIGAAPTESRSTYITTGTALGGIVGVVSPLLGGLLMQSLSRFPFPNHGLIRSNYDVLFVVASLMRFGILASAIAITEHESRSARYVLGQLRRSNPIATGAIQKLSRSSDSAGRVRAAAALGRMKAPIAVEELVKALDDAALPVREKAAEALGEIGDSRAVYPLLDKLKDPSSGISTGAAAALGKIGDHSALPELLAAARDDLGLTPHRVAAIEALGMLGQPQALDHMAEFVTHPFASLRIAALRALSMRSDIASSSSVRSAVLDGWKVEDDPSALPLLADALAQLGDPSLAVDLAEGLARANSPVTRRELLNAIGSLLGGRDSFYAYLALDRFAADDTLSKILISLQRQLRPTSRGAPGAGYAARFVVRIQQAHAAFATGQSQLCARRLYQAGQLAIRIAAGRSDPAADSARLGVLRVLDKRTGEAEIGHEELLLMVFIVRLLAVG